MVIHVPQLLIGVIFAFLIFFVGYFIGKWIERVDWNQLITDGVLPIPTKVGRQKAFVINPIDKFFPDANEWMWSYCTFLGKYIDKDGKKWDLGIYYRDNEILCASVYGNKDGQYTSGRITTDGRQESTADYMIELKRRLTELNLLTPHDKVNE